MVLHEMGQVDKALQVFLQCLALDEDFHSAKRQVETVSSPPHICCVSQPEHRDLPVLKSGRCVFPPVLILVDSRPQLASSPSIQACLDSKFSVF